MIESTEQGIIKAYSLQMESIDSKLAALTKRLNFLSFLRLISFIAAILSVYIFGSIKLEFGIFSVLILLAIFIYFVASYFKLQKQVTYEINLKTIVQNELNHFKDQLNLYNNGHQYADADHAYTDDLDIFGDASLFNFLNRSVTRNGNDILAGWLKDYSSQAEIEQRQESVRELKQHLAKTQWFRASLLPLNSNLLNDISYRLQAGTSQMFDFLNRKWLVLYAKLIPIVSLIIIFLSSFSIISWRWLFPLFIINYLITGLFVKKVNHIHELFGKSASQLKIYAVLLQWIENENWESVYLREKLTQCLDPANKQPAYKQADRLGRLIQQLDNRLNIYVSPFLQGFFLWDVRYSLKIKEWFDISAPTVIKSCNLIGEFEALISLATLHYNHPDWVFATISTGFTLQAQELGHPLIAAESRVYNDYRLKETKTADIITGSNMAGKSTFLRSVGVNLVLAFAGAPVCCKSLQVSLIRLVSYMRIKDSLHENTSTFKAELNRLKMILDITLANDNSFALIDEMLRGTNSKDKYLGTKAFIKKLINQDSAAIIATHDLQVAELEKEYPESVRNFHFDIQTDGKEMFFDYKIKNGECKTFNASMLLKQIGLDV